METKKILYTQPRVVELVTDETGDPGPNQVRVRTVISCLSSGTEKANLIGGANTNPTGKDTGFPKISGYSSAGIVDKVGEGVTHVKEGDRVAMRWSHHRGIQIINADFVYKMADNVSFEDAAFTHIASFPLAALRKCRTEIGESAIVMGMGVLGLMGIRMLKAAGAAPILAVDPDPKKREKALAVGADYALDPYAADFAETAKKLTNGGAKVGIEVTGLGAGLDGILDCMARYGRVALLGCTRNKDFTIDYYMKVHCPGITLIGAHTHARPKVESSGGWWTPSDDMEAILKLLELGRLELASVTDEMHSPEDAPEVYGRLLSQPSFPVVQFDWRLLK